MQKNTVTNPTPNPILYSFRRCPYAMRARLALYVSDITVEIREIILRDKPAQLIEISPKATVPVLLLPDGTVIDESLDIMDWTLTQNDPDNWLKSACRDLITQNDTTFKHALDRYKYPERYPEEDCTMMFEKGAEILKELNAHIAKNGALTAKENTLSDFAIFPFIRQFANTDKARFNALKLTALNTWLNAHLESPLFNAIMEKYVPWHPESTPVTLTPPKS